MAHSELILVWKIIVLGLMLFVNTSVQQQQTLATGYDYAGELIGNDQLHKDLKCGYLFGGYTQLRLFKLLLDRPTALKHLVNSIGEMNRVVRFQTNSLFGLHGIPIGAMWLLCLFTGFVEIHYQEYCKIQEPAEAYADLYGTLVYVVGELQADLVGCGEGNSFDRYNSVPKSRKTFNAYTNKKIILKQYLDEAERMVKDNRDGFLLCGIAKVHTKIHSLLLANLGTHDRLKYDLQNVYNVHIEWNQTSAELTKAWKRARYLDWHIAGLGRLKAYYNACFDFLKIVMVGLTLKHLKYLQVYTDVGSDSYLRYAQKWCNIVVQFGAMLTLSEDLHVYGMVNTLRNHIDGTQTLDSVVDYLNATLATLCRLFKCRADDPLILDHREFTINHTSLTEKALKFLRVVANPEPIEYNSLANAETFLTHLNLSFGDVNFGTIRSLMEYIDQLKRTNCVDSSEDYTEELETSHLLDISAFE